MFEFKAQMTKQKEYSEAFAEWMMNRANVLKVEQANLEDDKGGVDFWVYCPNKKSFQVKTDFVAHRTGNMAYELISQMYSNRESVPGWGMKIYQIDYLVYILAETGDIYTWKGEDLQHTVLQDYSKYRNFMAQNNGYLTAGILVPLVQLKHKLVFKGNLADMNAGG